MLVLAGHDSVAFVVKTRLSQTAQNSSRSRLRATAGRLSMVSSPSLRLQLTRPREHRPRPGAEAGQRGPDKPGTLLRAPVLPGRIRPIAIPGPELAPVVPPAGPRRYLPRR